MNNISLCMRPEVAPFGWEEFCATHGPWTIALDGYVAAGSRFDPAGPRLNLDHHTEVDRLATRATCAQTLLAIHQGLFDCFRDEHGPRADVCVNDCDEDVCTSWFLLMHADLAAPGKSPPDDEDGCRPTGQHRLADAQTGLPHPRSAPPPRRGRGGGTAGRTPVEPQAEWSRDQGVLAGSGLAIASACAEGAAERSEVMNMPITRQKIAPRSQGLRAELRGVKEKLKELEGRVDQLHHLLADRTYRLASRVSLLERGCAYVQVRDGS